MQENAIRVILKRGKEGPVRRFHPWVFSGAVARIEGEPADGSLVVVCDSKGDFLGTGHYHEGSITVRIISFDPETDPNSPEFWIDKISQARMLRAKCGLPSDQTNCYRLIHGEGDGLSGLVVDVYGSVAVVQCHSIGMHLQRDLIANAITKVLDKEISVVYDKSMETLPKNYAANQGNDYLIKGSDTELPLKVLENGVPFLIDWESGQKTGFFLDQRDNRQMLRSFAEGKKVLNLFCYTGGFSAYALDAGASMVHSVDVSEKAMQLTEQNVALQEAGPERHQGFTEDVPKFLKSSEELYDLIIVDPPAFAKSMNKRHNAVQAYKRLNALAFRRLAPGGIVFSFSCSQVIDRPLFYNTLVASAIDTGRQMQVLHLLSQGPDHPVSLFHPEGSYLKGIVASG